MIQLEAKGTLTTTPERKGAVAISGKYRTHEIRKGIRLQY